MYAFSSKSGSEPFRALGDLPWNDPEETVHAVKPVNNNRGHGGLTKRNQPYVCFTCGKAGHFRNNCQYKDSKCHNCGKLGHLSVVCKARPPANNALTK